MAHERSPFESAHWRRTLDGWRVGEHYYVETFGDAEYIGSAVGQLGDLVGIFRSVDTEGAYIIVGAEDFSDGVSYVVTMAEHIDSQSETFSE